jgi:hypothetical protein
MIEIIIKSDHNHREVKDDQEVDPDLDRGLREEVIIITAVIDLEVLHVRRDLRLLINGKNNSFW